jgi:hypothetical protein
VAAYEELLAGMAGTERKNQPTFGATLQAMIHRHAFIGSAADVRKLRGESVFPWYEKPLSRVARSKSAPPALFDSADQKLLGKLVPPLVFRDSFRGDLGIQTMFAVLASQASLRFTLPYVDSSKRAD